MTDADETEQYTKNTQLNKPKELNIINTGYPGSRRLWA